MFYPFLHIELDVIADGAGNSLGVLGYGNFHLGFSMTGVVEPSVNSQTSTWNYVDGQDYIAFRDSTTDPGFKFSVYMSSSDLGNFVYTGSSLAQTNVNVGNLKVWAKYQNPAYLSPDKGVDDSTKSLNILSGGSCLDAENLNKYSFAPDLLSGATNYALTMSNSLQDYLVADVSCEVEGHLEIQRMELEFPPGANDGTYRSQLIILVTDGIN